MNIIRKQSHYAQTVYTVLLTEDESQLSDDELITRADNNGEPGPVCHFGGKVERKPGKVSGRPYARITVYRN
jgi:hypothetical protein